MPPITNLSCIFIDTPDLEGTLAFYAATFGLTLIGQTDDAVALGGTLSTTRQVVLRKAPTAGLLALEFAVSSQRDVDRAGEIMSDQGRMSDSEALPFCSDSGITFSDPDSSLIRLRAKPATATTAQDSGDRPTLLSHVVINTPDVARLVHFFVETLGFVVSDKYERDLLTFLRADQPQHHCVGISPGTTASLNHFAVDCGNFDALMCSVGRMRQAGYEPIWGPGRHGPGGNIFCYYEDPNGLVAEYTCDLIQIPAGENWTPKIWERIPSSGNIWGTGAPSPRAVALMAGQRE